MILIHLFIQWRGLPYQPGSCLMASLPASPGCPQSHFHLFLVTTKDVWKCNVNVCVWKREKERGVGFWGIDWWKCIKDEKFWDQIKLICRKHFELEKIARYIKMEKNIKYVKKQYLMTVFRIIILILSTCVFCHQDSIIIKIYSRKDHVWNVRSSHLKTN